MSTFVVVPSADNSILRNVFATLQLYNHVCILSKRSGPLLVTEIEKKSVTARLPRVTNV